MITLNIFDDYAEYGDDFWTDIRVESFELSNKQQKDCLEVVQKYIEEFVDLPIDTAMTLLDEQLIFQNLYHEDRKKLLLQLNIAKLSFHENELFFISES